MDNIYIGGIFDYRYWGGGGSNVTLPGLFYG